MYYVLFFKQTIVCLSCMLLFQLPITHLSLFSKDYLHACNNLVVFTNINICFVEQHYTKFLNCRLSNYWNVWSKRKNLTFVKIGIMKTGFPLFATCVHMKRTRKSGSVIKTDIVTFEFQRKVLVICNYIDNGKYFSWISAYLCELWKRRFWQVALANDKTKQLDEGLSFYINF